MIFQLGLELNIEQQDVQAIIDLDTGLIGFVERFEGNDKEYLFLSAPPEYKKALLEKLLEQAAERPYLNSKISRKSKQAAVLFDFLKAQNNPD